MRQTRQSGSKGEYHVEVVLKYCCVLFESFEIPLWNGGRLRKWCLSSTRQKNSCSDLQCICNWPGAWLLQYCAA